jgi:fructokinase
MNVGSSRIGDDDHVDVAGTGFTVLDRLYEDGGLSDEALGGSCGNVLISLAMLRRHVAPVLALGNDQTGELLVNEFVQAGAVVRYITRRADIRSPMLAQELNTASGHHDFSFVCPETQEQWPRYQPISETELTSALSVLARCRIFYTDRLSESILKAMRAASSAGAIVFFEPSIFDEHDMFAEALSLASILKYSEDRLGDRLADWPTTCVRIVTHGASGLEVRDEHKTFWCNRFDAPDVLDTCGSGDMVSVGVIDWMLTSGIGGHRLEATELLTGIVAGQRLAAENCAYAGARGLFKKRGAQYVRDLLDLGYSAASR